MGLLAVLEALVELLEVGVPLHGAGKGGEEGGFKRGELDRVQFGPAGDLLTTAGDIAKFMLVHLNNGAYGDGADVTFTTWACPLPAVYDSTLKAPRCAAAGVAAALAVIANRTSTF